jgi:hypothetical protein
MEKAPRWGRMPHLHGVAGRFISAAAELRLF